MKLNPIKSFAPILAVILAAPLLAAPADDVMAAAKKLTDAKSYSWEIQREGSRFWTGTVKGQMGKDGVALVTQPGREGATYQTAFHGEKAAAETEDGWQTAAELENAEGFQRFLAFSLRRFQAPAKEVTELLKHTEALTSADGVISGKIKPEGVRELLSFGRGQGPEVMDPAGTVKFSLKDGSLQSYEVSLKGTMTFNDNDVDVSRTSKVSISKVGETEFELPAGAKEKLGVGTGDKASN